MTNKRFRKLFGAFMSQYMQGKPGAGIAIYNARHISSTPQIKENGYMQSWKGLCEYFDPDEYPVIAQGINQMVKRHQY